MPDDTGRPTPRLVSPVTSVLTGDPVRLSASSVATFRDCRRKWWFQKVGGHSSPGSAATALGGEVHTLLEQYIVTGAHPGHDTKAARVASAGLHNIPQGLEPHNVETMVEGMIGPLAYLGFIDMWRPGWIGDHKTTSDWRWSKTAEQLAYNPQMLFYGAAAVRQGIFDKPHDLHMSHLYYLTRGTPEGRRVDVTVPFDRALVEWNQSERIAEEMAKLAQIDEQQNVHKNLSACRKYGGCPFVSMCDRAPPKAKPLTEEQKMSAQDEIAKLKAQLKAAKKAKKKKSKAAAPEGTKAAPAKPVAPEGTKARELQDKMNDKLAAAGKPPRYVVDTPSGSRTEHADGSAEVTGDQIDLALSALAGKTPTEGAVQDVIPPDAAPQAYITDALLDEVAERFQEMSAELENSGADYDPEALLRGMMKREGIPDVFFDEMDTRASGGDSTPVAELFPDGEPAGTVVAPESPEERKAKIDAMVASQRTALAKERAARLPFDPSEFRVDDSDDEPNATEVAKAAEIWFRARGGDSDGSEVDGDELRISSAWFRVVVREVVGALYKSRSTSFRMTNNRFRSVAARGGALGLWTIANIDDVRPSVVLDMSETKDASQPEPAAAPATKDARQPAPAAAPAPQVDPPEPDTDTDTDIVSDGQPPEIVGSAPPEPVVVTAPKKPDPAPSPVVRILYLDCAPDDGSAIEASIWLDKLIRQVEREHRVGHYLATDYADGCDAIAAKVATGLAKGTLEWPHGGVILSHWDGFHKGVRDVLLRQGAFVVRGRR